MTLRQGRWGSARFLTVAALAVALAAALAAAAGLFDRLNATPSAVAELRRQELSQSLTTLLERAAEAAEVTLAASASPASARSIQASLGPRIDGTALLDAAGRFITWTGTPAEPPRDFVQPSWPRWSIRVDGTWTRLLVRAGPDENGRFALVSAVIDAATEARRFLDLVPRSVTRGVQIEVNFLDTRFVQGEEWYAIEPEEAPPPSSRVPDGETFWLRTPSGDIVAVAALAPLSPEIRAARVRRSGGAAASVLAVLIALISLPWPALTRSIHGLLAAFATLTLARLLLVWQKGPATLLPHELGSASLFGSRGFFGLVASPADLLLSGFALFLAAVALRRYLGSLGERRIAAARLLALFAAAVTSVVGAIVTLSLARNSRLPLLDRPAPFEWSPALVIWIGWVLFLIAAAELWARSVTSFGPNARVSSARLAVIASLVVMLAGSTVLLQQSMLRLDVEQLGSELAAEITEQSARRTAILHAAMREIEERVLRHDLQDPTQYFAPVDMAYRYWVGGELFHSGYRSSLAFYTPTGHQISHYGFGLPVLDEMVALAPDAVPAEPRLRAERFDATAAIDRALIHAELPIFRDDQPLGMVVGHIVDEPDNLPFLRVSQPYLAALGPGPPGAGRNYPEPLHYVLFDEKGEIELTTLLRPPDATREIREATESRQPFRVRVGSDVYVGVALRDARSRLHLLLLPLPGLLGRMASIVRVGLFGFSILFAIRFVAVLRRRNRRGGLRSLGRRLRGSLYRKLLSASLLAAGVPLIGLALLIGGYIERRANASLVAQATQLVGVASRVVEDYSAISAEDGTTATINDQLLFWLRNVVGQEILVYQDGLLLASSRRELFASGLLPARLPGPVQTMLVEQGLPYLVLQTPLGPVSVPVAYARARIPGADSGDRVVAVPLVLEQQQIAAATARVAEMILLATVSLFGLLAAAAAILASSVARPVRDLVAATARISSGDYSTRLEPRTHDEVADLVQGFNAMGTALEGQRTDLESQRDYMETLLHHDTTGVISVDSDGRIVTVNPSAAALLGTLRSPQLVGRDIRETLAADEELQPLAQALEVPAARGPAVEVDLDRDGSRLRYQVVRIDLEGAAGRGVGTLYLLDDVTDLMRSNQLAAWAEMASVIAHEIKNPLTPIQLSSEHLRRLLRDRGLLPAPDMEACLDTIIKQVRSLYTIAGEFSAYSKLPALQPEPQDPVEFVRSTLDPYRAAPANGIRLVEDYVSTPAVAIDRRVLSRALINLIENALQAMPDGGELSIGVQPDDRREHALLSVRDTGPGLAPEVRRRLFEPYFSTKSSGTGLGLAIVRRAVEGHGGTIEVSSGRGGGTAFVIRLPFR